MYEWKGPSYENSDKWAQKMFDEIKNMSNDINFTNMCLSDGCYVNAISNGILIWSHFKENDDYFMDSPEEDFWVVSLKENKNKGMILDFTQYDEQETRDKCRILFFDEDMINEKRI